MGRLRRPRAVVPARGPLRLHHRLIVLLLTFLPTLLLTLWLAQGLLQQVEAVLGQSAPLVQFELSRYLGREVRIGRINPRLTLNTLGEWIRAWPDLGTITVTAEDVAVAQDGKPLAAGPLASARRAVLTVSLTRLAAGDFSAAVPRIVLESPDLLLIRRADGRLNVQDLVRKPKKGGGKPFRTVVVAQNGKLRFRDYAAKLPTSALPAENQFADLNATVDLSAERRIQVSASAASAPNSRTIERLQRLVVAGSVDRVPAETAAPQSARYLFTVRATNAKIPYWLDYLFDLPNTARITAGQADALIRVGAPRPDAALTAAAADSATRPPSPPPPPPPLLITGEATIRNAAALVQVPLFRQPLPITQAQGRVAFDSGGVLNGELRGQALGAPITVRGAVWNLTSPTAQKIAPQLAVQFSVRNLALPEATKQLAAGRPLPPALRLTGTLQAQGAIEGALARPVMTGTVGVSEMRYGLASARHPLTIAELQTSLTYVDGVLGVARLQARISGGGQVQGRGVLRLGEIGPAGNLQLRPPVRRAATFSLRASDFAIGPVRAAILAATGGAKNSPNLPPISGQASVAVVGSWNGARGVQAAANLAADDVRAGSDRAGAVQIAQVRARLRYDRGRVLVPALSLTSSAGVAFVHGDVSPGRALALQWQVVGLDIGKFARAFAGASDLGGLLTAWGTIGGTTDRPQVIARSVQALRPHYAGYGADLITGSFVLTPERLTLSEPLVVRRFPAAAFVSGTITELNRLPNNVPGSPRLALDVRLADLSLDEILRQAQPATVKTVVPAAGSPGVANTSKTQTLRDVVEGRIENLRAEIRGTLARPRVDGTATLNDVALYGYTIDEGTLTFGLREGDFTVADARLTSSLGTVRASVTLRKNGTLSGSFDARDLQLESQAALTRRFAQLDGTLSLTGEIRGTRTVPILITRILPSSVTVAGTPLQNLRSGPIQVVVDLRGKQTRIRADVPEIAFEQNGTQVRVSASRYASETGAFQTRLGVVTGDIGVLLETIRQSGIAETATGQKIIAVLDKLPPLGGRFTVEDFTVTGRLAAGKIAERQVSAHLSGEAVRIGQFVADNAEIIARLDGDRITLERLRITNAETDTTIRGRGTAVLGGNVDLALESSNASLQLLQPFLPDRDNDGKPDFTVDGRVDLFVTALGLLRTPTITASLEQSGLSEQVVRLGPVRLTRLRVPRITLTPTEGSVDADGFPPGEIRIEDALAARGDNRVTLSGTVPFDYAALRLDPDRSVALRLTAPEQSIAPLLSGFIGKPDGVITPPNDPSAAATTAAAAAAEPRDLVGGEAAGTLSAQLDISGSLENPRFSPSSCGRIAEGRLVPPHPRGEVTGDPINPIRDLNMDLGFDANQITVRNLSLALGGPNKSRGDFGSVAVRGAITDLNLFALGTKNQREDAPPPGRLNLTVSFNKLRPVVDSISGLLAPYVPLGEKFRGTVAGEMRIVGPLLRPLLTTRAGAIGGNGRPSGEQNPLRVSEAYLQPPQKQLPDSSGRQPSTFDPRFDIQVTTADAATLAAPGLYTARATGDLTVAGALAQPEVRGDFAVEGGSLALPTARFALSKGGRVRLQFEPPSPAEIRVDTLTAQTTIYATPDSRFGRDRTAGSLTNFGSLPISSTPSVTGRSTRYRISITLNGRLALGDATQNLDDLQIAYSSDPPLSQSEIIALIGNQRQIQLAASGQVEEALKQVFAQTLQSRVLPSLLSPLESEIARGLGLEEFSIQYAPDLPLSLFLSKRLSPPFERFLLSYQRTVGSGAGVNQTQPYQFGLFYEFYELGIRPWLRPRLQAGVTFDEQHTTTLTLRGTLYY